MYICMHAHVGASVGYNCATTINYSHKGNRVAQWYLKTENNHVIDCICNSTL